MLSYLQKKVFAFCAHTEEIYSNYVNSMQFQRILLYKLNLAKIYIKEVSSLFIL